jgi:hypothetical protein
MPLPVAAWVSRHGRPVAEVLDLPPEQIDRPLIDLIAERCVRCGVLGLETYEAPSGRRCALDVAT